MAIIDNKIYFKELSNKFDKNYFDFLALVYRRFNKSETEKILNAYKFANNAHDGQLRKSGEPYINHPLNVAYFLASEGFDSDTVCAALLHDVVEDTKYNLKDIEENFGKDISVIVDGVTKMKGSKFLTKEEVQKLTHQKILDSITKDARIIAVKLIDRLHNMYTLEYLKSEKQKRIAYETVDFYVNLARILGVYKIKDDLQDLCLSITNPDDFLRLYEYRKLLEIKHFSEYKDIGESTKKDLLNKDILMDYNFKIKNIGGIYSDFKKGTNVDKIKDLLSIRMLLFEEEDCYKTLESILSLYKKEDNSFTDYIKNPKYNGYKSLIQYIYSDKDSLFRVGIRTPNMQWDNNLGIIRNWNEETQKQLNDDCSKMIKENKKELKRKEII